jgi:hypothetical protein
MGVVDELIENGLLVPLDAKPITSKRGYYIVARRGFLDTPPGTLLWNALQKRS